MSSMISLMNAVLAWGDLPLLDNASFTINSGDRIGLIGRNGIGKSSLLSVMAQRNALDGGEMKVQDGLRIAFVEQEPVFPKAGSLKESLIIRGKLSELPDDAEKWSRIAKLDAYLTRFEVHGDRPAENASGGEKKRAALALAFAEEADLLLLDEPTNHLDINGINRLEELILSEYRGQRALMMITHDRAFLDSTVTEILELDRGILRAYPGNFSAYESRKEEELHAEDLFNRRFDKFWAQEEVWIRKGIEARRTRNEGRVRRLEALRQERAARRERIGSMRINIDAGQKSGKIVAETEGLCKRFGERVIVKDLNFTMMRGDRLGIIGPNGIGKSTLIKLLLGEIPPDSGKIRTGTNLQIAYFDQLRKKLDLSRTVAETISPGSDWVEIAGVRKHIAAYLEDFLFSPRKAKVPVQSLSGGERNRLLLARLFALPANLLVLDEPTNDLDIDSLDMLEQALANYPGTIILVSHDRRFLDNVVTDMLVPDGEGHWLEFAGGYTEWDAYQAKLKESAPTVPKTNATDKPAPKARVRQKRVKLTYKEAKELEALPAEIESMEAELNRLVGLMSTPDYHSREPAQLRADAERCQALQSTIEAGYARWSELEKKSTQASLGVD